MVYYRPRSEASEGYVFTGVCHSVTERGGEGGVNQGLSHNTSLPPGTSSQHLPPSLPPGPGHNTSPPRDLVTTPPPGTWSQHLPPPRTWSQHLHPPLGPGHNTSPPPRDLVTTPPPLGTWSQHLPPSPPGLGTMPRRAVRILLE